MPLDLDYDKRTDLVRLFNIFMVPTVVFTDAKMVEHYRSIGYLPPDRFMAEMLMGRAWSAFGVRRYGEAGDTFDRVASQYSICDIAPQAIFFRAISKDKLEGGYKNRIISAQELQERYPDSDWAIRLEPYLDLPVE